MMRKISRNKARAIFATGKEFIIVPCNCSPIGMFSYRIDSTCFDNMTFERVENSFIYYNCNKETGRKPAFYVNDDTAI